MAYASAPQLPKASKRHPRVCQPESIDKPPTKNPIQVSSARAKQCHFQSCQLGELVAGEAGGGEGRTGPHTASHRHKAHQARQNGTQAHAQGRSPPQHTQATAHAPKPREDALNRATSPRRAASSLMGSTPAPALTLQQVQLLGRSWPHYLESEPFSAAPAP